MFHITNGDSVKYTLGNIPGESMVWCDILHHGPTPQGLAIGDEKWNQVRAAFHTSLGFDNYENCLAKLAAADKALMGWSVHDEAVLWYEHDLFDQLILMRLLAHFALHSSPVTKISIVGLENFVAMPGFRGLGELSESQMQIACQTRKPLSQEQFLLGYNAWKAFTSPYPTEIEKLLAGDTGALPYLQAALRRHLMEFPSTENGLSQTERFALESLRAGRKSGWELFRAVQDREEAPFLGDTTFFALLRPLARCAHALLDVSGEDLGAAQFELTALGEEVLAGRQDWVLLNGIDTWRGGCRLHSGATIWRYEAAKDRLVADDRLNSPVKPLIC